MPESFVITVPAWIREADPGLLLIAAALLYYFLTAFPARWALRKGFERGGVVMIWALSWFIFPILLVVFLGSGFLWLLSLGVFPSPLRVMKGILDV